MSSLEKGYGMSSPTALDELLCECSDYTKPGALSLSPTRGTLECAKSKIAKLAQEATEHYNSLSDQDIAYWQARTAAGTALFLKTCTYPIAFVTGIPFLEAIVNANDAVPGWLFGFLDYPQVQALILTLTAYEFTKRIARRYQRKYHRVMSSQGVLVTEPSLTIVEIAPIQVAHRILTREQMQEKLARYERTLPEHFCRGAYRPLQDALEKLEKFEQKVAPLEAEVSPEKCAKHSCSSHNWTKRARQLILEDIDKILASSPKGHIDYILEELSKDHGDNKTSSAQQKYGIPSWL